MLLTEGWDCPIVDCIVVLRPTKIRSLYCQMLGRGTRPYEGKDHLLVLDFLWMTGKHDLVRPADIICKKEEIAKKVTEKLEGGEQLDLFATEEQVERDVMEERKNALARELEEAAKHRAKKQKKLIDPLEYSLSIDMDDMIDYVPTFGWEAMPATDKQIAAIENFGLDPTGMCKGQASKIISKLMQRVEAQMSTPRQIKTLNKFGFQNVQNWTRDEATKIIASLAAAGWKPWIAHIDPSFYQPKRLAEQGVEWI
jgi:type I site-specific restriction endonuclease